MFIRIITVFEVNLVSGMKQLILFGENLNRSLPNP
ncbi:unnamed protein product [Tenebrio molitor]|nr:unnamed protein product [Tenebrio molitor]